MRQPFLLNDGRMIGLENKSAVALGEGNAKAEGEGENMTVSKPLRIAIATGGRFHVLDLARELDALGHEVRFYSYVPKARALKFGLPARCHVSLLPFMWPLIAWERLLPNAAPEMREKLLASRSIAPSWPAWIHATSSLACPG